MGVVRRTIGPVVIAVLGGGCMGSGASHHPTLSRADALTQARSDGFVHAAYDKAPSSYRCTERTFELGPVRPATSDVGYVRPLYVFEFEDRRAPVVDETSTRIGLLIIVFPDAATAARCARAAIYLDEHIQIDRIDPASPTRPYKLIDPTTVETYMHKRGLPGSVSPKDDGRYDTFLSHGRVLGLGTAYNGPQSKIARDDLERLAAEIAG